MSDVILYKEDIDRLNGILESLVTETRILAGILVNKDTRLLANYGNLGLSDLSALSALIVGSFSSTQAIAGLVGEKEFGMASHCGRTKNLLVTVIDEDTILATIFERKVSLTAVSSSIARHVDALRKALYAIKHNMETMFSPDPDPSTMPSMSQDDVDKGFDSFFDPKTQAIKQQAPAQVPPPVQQYEPAPLQHQQQAYAYPQTVSRPPETKQFQYAAPVSEPAHVAPQTMSDHERNATKIPQHMQQAPRQVQKPANAEQVYFSSSNHVKNKTNDGVVANKQASNRGFFSKLFSKSR